MNEKITYSKDEYSSNEITEILGITQKQQAYIRNKFKLPFKKGGNMFCSEGKKFVTKPVYPVDSVRAMEPYARKHNCIPTTKVSSSPKTSKRTIISKYPDFNGKPYVGKSTEFFTMSDLVNMGFKPTIELAQQVYAICRDKNIAYIHNSQPAYPDYVWGTLMGVNF